MILVLQGLPASGKSTFRQAWMGEGLRRAYINYDELRRELYGPTWVFNYDDEDKMKKVAMERARAWMTEGCDLCIDNLNLQKRHWERWAQLAAEFKTDIQVKTFDTPVHVCVDQDRRRKSGRVGRAVIENLALRNGLINWSDYAFYGDRNFVICDIDGTVADLSHRRKYLEVKCDTCGSTEAAFTKKGVCTKCGGKRTKKDWDKFFKEAGKDAPFRDIINLVAALSQGHYILFVSGRPDDKCGTITEDWLARQYIKYEHLFMRRGGDYRPDDEVKEEILGFLPKGRITYVLDDRDRVVKMWRKNGLRVLQVAEGDF